MTVVAKRNLATDSPRVSGGAQRGLPQDVARIKHVNMVWLTFTYPDLLAAQKKTSQIDCWTCFGSLR